MKKLLFLLLSLSVFNAQSQIVVDNTSPYDDPVWMTNNILIGGGVAASNIVYQGDSCQIGFFNAINTSLGIDSGIVLCTGDVNDLDPASAPTFPFITNTVVDPDLLAVANSVPGMIGQTFTVSSVNDIAILEFDFIPTSDSLQFRYAFGSQEYFAYENTQYNDVFGFFLSGPGIAGPWSNGAVNLAYIPNTTPQMPITISSVNSVTPINQQYFVDNQNGLDTIADADGYTTVFTAQALVQCGSTYHIKLAIADGSDSGLSSYVWLEAGSFSSPELQVYDNLGIDSTIMDIACGADIILTADVADSTATFEWFDSTSVIFSTDSSVSVGTGSYVVAATINGCTVFSDTLEVISEAPDSLPPPVFDCASVSDTLVYVDWLHPLGATTSTHYYIFGALNVGGPYYNVADVYYPTDSYILNENSMPFGTNHYFVTTSSECFETVNSDTISPMRFNISSLDVNCWDDTDGIINVGVDDYINVLQYSFSIDGVVNTNAFPMDTVFTGVSAGSHIITVDDVTSGCVIDIPVTISAPGFPLQALISSQTLNLCFDDTTAIAIGSSAGGTPGYSYEWFEFGNPQSFSTSDTALGLSAGSYILEVMDANGCDTFASVNVIEPQTALGGSPQIFGVQCKGDATGMLVGDASGSWAPYRYEWFDMSGNLLQISGMISERDTLFDLSAGSYILKIFDAQGCEVEYVLNVPEPNVALAIDSMILIDDIACHGDSVGRAMLSVSGGQPNYYYEWDNGETTLVAEELTSGWHSVLLTDDWGCKLVDSVFIPENSLIESELLVDTTVSCYGASDGQASISTVGGSSSLYTYYWSTSQTTLNADTDIAVGLAYGSYYVTTRDDLGCEVVDSVYISEPEPLSMEAMELDWIDCYNDATGEGAATAVGGTAPYVFSWDNGVWIGDTITTLTKGLHTVVVTDLRGCTASDTIEIHNPDSLYIVIDESQTVLPYCMGVNTASLSAVATGGTGMYWYEWNDNDAYPQTTTTASGLLPDNYYNTVDSSYTITVTDEKGCTASVTTDTLQTYVETMGADTVFISQYYSGTANPNEVSCFGLNDGEVAVNVWGGHAPYTYDWIGNSFSANTATITNLYAGVYSVFIKDTNDCMVNSSIELIEPLELRFNTSVVLDESCLGACDGEIVVDSIAGGVATYSALLTNNTTGVTTSHTMVNDVITGVCSGDYTVALTDANSCLSVVISGGIDQQLVGTPEVTEADIVAIEGEVCYAGLTGELTVNNPNTNTGYTYSWENVNNPGQSIATTTTVSNLGAGTYVLLSDYNNTAGCTDTDTFTITSLAMLEITYHVVTDADCYGASTGEVAVTADPLGVTPYSYSWSSGATTATATNLSAGTHILTLTDGNGCDQDFSYTVSEPTAVNVNVVTSQGYILTANATGGTPPYSYSWEEQSTANSLGAQQTYTVVSNGIYYVVVTDANGCIETSGVTEFDETTGLITTVGVIALNIYPNPFKDETTVDFGREIKEATITIVDVYGKLIETYNVTNQQTQIIKRNNKASGVYFLEIEIEEEELKIVKIVLEK